MTATRDRIGLELADLREATRVIVERHYLHRGRTMAQVAYWVTLDSERCGVALFALPRMSVASPKFGSHSAMSLIELARLWLDPDVQGHRVTDSHGVTHTLPVASVAVGQALRRIRLDWYGKYPHLPEIRACVSWADTVRHQGTIYRATNFCEVGSSGGRTHGTRARTGGGADQAHDDYRHVKTAFLYTWNHSLTDAEKTAALAEWDATRPRHPAKKHAAALRKAELSTDG